MRTTFSNKNAKENFFSKNVNNYGNYYPQNSRSPPKMLNNYNQNPLMNKPSNFQSLIQKKELNPNNPIKINSGINSLNTPYKLKENGTQSPNLPIINSNNGGYNSYGGNGNNSVNVNHSRFSSNISNNANFNVNNGITNNLNSNSNIINNSFNNYNSNKTPNTNGIKNNNSLNSFNSSINNSNNNYASNGGNNNNISANSNSNRNPSAKHNSSLSYSNHSEANNNLNNLRAGSSYLNNSNSNLDSSGARNRPSSRNQSNTSITNSYNYNNNINSNYNNNLNSNNKISENDITSNIPNNTKINLNNNGNSLQIKLDISRKLVGLKNLGNTCFMNTSLQCLLHSEPFISRFLDYCDLKRPLRPTPISNSLLNLIESYSKSSDKSAVSPDELKSAVARKHRVYTGFSQQDSQEFIRKLLEEISQELNTVSEIKPYRMLKASNELEDKKELNSEYDKIFRERENSIIVDTFYGQSISIFQCVECNFESYSFEKFLDIPLLLEESYSDQDVSKLLGKYFESENILWESPCDNKQCRKKSVHRKKLKLSGMPDILILSLQRYNNRLRRKNNCRVNFKEEIDMNLYTDSASLSDNKTKYSLAAISNHSGSLDFGHYYAYCKVNDVWYEFNDSNVSKMYSLNNSSETAYVLFYRKLKY